MKRFHRPSAPLPSIRSKLRGLVKLPLALICLHLASSADARSDDLSLRLPDIEARTYSVNVVKKSRSGRVYLLQVTGDEPPKQGKIVLLKSGESNAMAFRVLKIYPDKKQFAGKSVRKYDAQGALPVNQSYTALEKLADVVPAPLSQQDRNELRELEKPPPPVTLAPTPAAPKPSILTQTKPPAAPVVRPAPPRPPVVAPPAYTPPPAAVARVATPPPVPVAPIPSPEPQLPALPPETPPAAVAVAPPTDTSGALAVPPPPGGDAPPSPVPTAAIDDLLATPGADATPTPTPTDAPVANAAATDPNALPPPPANAAPFDADLDAATSPKPDAANDNLSEKEQQDIDDMSRIVVDEVTPFERESQWLTLGFGFFRNYKVNGAAAYFNGGQIRYGLNVASGILISKKKSQDSLTLELGLAFYKLINFAYPNDNDSFTVIPVTGTARYNIFFSQDLAIFFYGGLNYNWVPAANNPTPNTQSNYNTIGAAFNTALLNLHSVNPAIGTGLLFRVGPNWHARMDLGYDVIDLGLVLRF